jgi:hypothetical protein
MTDTAQDKWATRYPEGYVVNDLTPEALNEWRDMARREDAHGYVVPYSDKPTAPMKHGREMDACPSLRWMRGRVS